jgi:hypothetical protein
LVHLPPSVAVAAEEPSPPTSPEATAPTALAPAAEAMVSLIQTTISTVLGPLVGELATSRQTIERQADQLVSQAETIGRQSERVAGLETEMGRLEAELVAERAAQSTLAASGGPETSGMPESAALSRWRAWEPRLLALVTLAIAVALLAWLW